MNIRWMAVMIGYVVDLVISLCVVPFWGAESMAEVNLTRTSDLILVGVQMLATGVGGYVAGRIAGRDRALHGLLVGAVGVLIIQFSGPLPQALVIPSAIGCLLGALGGALSRIPPQQRQS